jgi:hypothetical protein
MPEQNYGVNVTAFGADPSGGTDSTTAFEHAISTVSTRGGGIVFVPQGTYKISRTLRLNDFVSLRGESRSTTLDFSAQQDGSAILIADVGNLIVEQLQIWNPAGNGIDIRNMSDSKAEYRNFCLVRDVVVRDERSNMERGTRGGSGFFGQNVYLTSFERCKAEKMRDYGFYFAGFHTTIKLDTCEASECKKSGYFLIKMIYSILTNCGSDSNQGYGYFLANCQSVSLNSCGAERSYYSSIGMAASDAWANDWKARIGMGELRGITISSFCSISGNTSGDPNFGDYMTLNAENGKMIEGSSVNHFALDANGLVIKRASGSAKINFPVWQALQRVS